jgi:predicted aldo/keto reductase-like oxidoreductase
MLMCCSCTCDQQKDYDEVMDPGGYFDLAQRLRQEGKARFLGFSGHTVATALRAVESGVIDVLMFPINIAGNMVPGKKELLQACVLHNVGGVAMKPYAGGKLLQKERTLNLARFKMGGDPQKL